jgi:hypothetical protein
VGINLGTSQRANREYSQPTQNVTANSVIKGQPIQQRQLELSLPQ